jgi:ribosomal-protein-alanine N-acetyltransferase
MLYPMALLKDKPLIEFARHSDAVEISMLSRSDIEHGLEWKYTPEKIVKLIADSSRNVVVARVESKLVGFGIMTYRDDQANLDLLAVKQRMRRMKIGTQLVQWLTDVAITVGTCSIFVQVRAHNTGAIAFYQGLGFGLLEEKKGYYDGVEAALILAKTLRPMFIGT